MAAIVIKPATGDSSYHAPAEVKTTRERILSSTVSVDEYFDELITLVQEDYANL